MDVSASFLPVDHPERLDYIFNTREQASMRFADGNAY